MPILAVACGLLATAAFAQTPAETGATQSAPSAQDFVNKVAISDMFEIQSSQLALSKQADKDTKRFAQRMVTDHQKTSKELKSMVDGGKVKATLPSALDREHQKMLDDLKERFVAAFGSSTANMTFPTSPATASTLATRRVAAIGATFGEIGGPAA